MTRPETPTELTEPVAAGIVTPAARRWTHAPRRRPVPAGERFAGELLDEQRRERPHAVSGRMAATEI
ncbi:MAG: hypothetical protein ACRDXB_00095 [Actinomycetes bacterium]